MEKAHKIGSPYKPTKAGITAMRRHNAMVKAIHEALRSLEEPFAPGDEVPGAIQDAIDVLRESLAP